MNRRNEGLLGGLRLMAEGAGRQAELIAGRDAVAGPQLQVVETTPALKFFYTRLQLSRLFATGDRRKVGTRH